MTTSTTFPPQRLTSRRITALSIAVSLVVIAVAGVVALVVVRDANQPVAQTPSTHVVETVVQPAPPPPPSTPPTAAATTSGQPRPPRRTSSQR